MLKTGFLAKNQLPSVKPDPIVVPSPARICKREHLDRPLCPIRSLKFCLEIKAHEVRALSFSWAFFDKVPLNDILQTAVWNGSSTFARFYLKDMSQQAENLQWAPLWWPKKWWGPNSIQLWKHRQRQQPPTPDATLERYLIYTNYVILYLLIDIS